MNDFVAVPAITMICYLVAESFKSFAPVTWKKKIPVLCAMLGMALGAICFFFAKDIIPAENPLTAAAIGIVSGFSATGVNQAFKQTGDKGNE